MSIDWHKIVREHGPAVYGAAWRVLGHADDAEDVVQEVFLEAQQLTKPHKVQNWAGFLMQMTAFRSVDRLRQRKPTTSLSKSLAASTAQPETVALDAELQAELRAAIAQLPRQQSVIFCLRFFEELPNKQIAESLDMSESAVSTAINKAKQRLRTIIEPPQDQSS